MDVAAIEIATLNPNKSKMTTGRVTKRPQK
jgi:hypothetical protein